MREIGIQELFEAMHPSQLSGAYQIMINDDEADRIEWPTFYKKQGVLIADVFSNSMKPSMSRKHVTVYIFGTKNPYEKLRTFMSQNYDVHLDEYDFGVSSLLDDGRLPIGNSLPTAQEVHKQMQQAMTKAKVV